MTTLNPTDRRAYRKFIDAGRAGDETTFQSVLFPSGLPLKKARRAYFLGVKLTGAVCKNHQAN